MGGIERELEREGYEGEVDWTKQRTKGREGKKREKRKWEKR